jgi:hypothetical protein
MSRRSVSEYLRVVGTSPTRKRQRVKGFSIFRVLERVWIPLVIAIVIGLGGFTVARIHGIFGSERRPQYSDSATDDSKPFNPKRITYEVFGSPGATADISYFDTNADPQHVDGAKLPWTLKMTTKAASVVGNIVAQGNGDSLGCRIIIDDVKKVEHVSKEVNAFTYCVLKGA